MSKLTILPLTVLAGITFIASCQPEDEHSADVNTHAVQAINITEVNTVLPQAGNVALIESSCVPCHSLRYIEMQPKLSLKTWEKIVDKMIKIYGAPVRDSATRQDIINYLYAIKGKK